MPRSQGPEVQPWHLRYLCVSNRCPGPLLQCQRDGNLDLMAGDVGTFSQLSTSLRHIWGGDAQWINTISSYFDMGELETTNHQNDKLFCPSKLHPEEWLVSALFYRGSSQFPAPHAVGFEASLPCLATSRQKSPLGYGGERSTVCLDLLCTFYSIHIETSRFIHIPQFIASINHHESV